MKKGDLVRLVDGPNRTYKEIDSVGLVISSYTRAVHDGQEYHEVEVLFPSGLFRHPHFPISLFEVIDDPA